jgi:hypothetical protein
MLIDELLLQMPYQFIVSESKGDYFELTAKPGIEVEQEDDLSPIGPKDKITVEVLSTQEDDIQKAMRRYRKERLNIPDDAKGMVVEVDDEDDFPFCICIFRVDNPEKNERKLFFLKTGVANNYQYGVMILIHKEITEGSGLTMSDLTSWPAVLKEHITADPYYKEMYA